MNLMYIVNRNLRVHLGTLFNMDRLLPLIMSRKVCLARGGTLTRFSGIGGAHHSLLDHHKSGDFPDTKLVCVLEYPEQKGALGKISHRWIKHPKIVTKFCQESLGSDDILHITDQEQAHLVPERYHGRPKVLVTVHDLFHMYPYQETISITQDGKEQYQQTISVGNQKPGLVRKYDLKKLIAGLSRADVLICDSEFTRRVCEEKFPNVEAITIPLGLDCEKYIPKTEIPKNSKFEMLFVGSADPRKRLNFVAEILGACDSRVKENSVLHIVGDRSSTADKILETLELEVIIHQSLDDEQLMRLRQKCDLLLFPSAAEGYGYPPIESMASGCPVLCADLPAHNELMPENSCLPPGDISAWVAAINSNFDSWQERDSKIPNQELIGHSKRFSSEQFVKKLNQIYNF